MDNKNANLLHNLATVYEEKKLVKKAVDTYELALELDDNLGASLANLTYLYRHTCDWAKYDKIVKKLDKNTKKSVRAGLRPSETPFFNIVRQSNPAYHLRVAEKWSEAVVRTTRSFGLKKFKFRRTKVGKKLKVGYVSDAFREYPTAHNITEIFFFSFWYHYLITHKIVHKTSPSCTHKSKPRN